MNTYRSEAEVSENACSEYEVRVAEAATTIGRPCEAGAPTEPTGETQVPSPRPAVFVGRFGGKKVHRTFFYSASPHLLQEDFNHKL